MKEDGVICPFEHVQVLEERYNYAIKEFWETTLQVDHYGFFIADGKWKLTWKAITDLKMNDEILHISTIPPSEDDEDANGKDKMDSIRYNNGNDKDDDDDGDYQRRQKKKGIQVQARIASVTTSGVNSQWDSFQHYVTKKWNKRQEKKQRKEEAIKQQAEEDAREARRAALKPKRSRMERFILKNLANTSKTFNDESDDETFNRRNHKELMAERRENTNPLRQESNGDSKEEEDDDNDNDVDDDENVEEDEPETIMEESQEEKDNDEEPLPTTRKNDTVSGTKQMKKIRKLKQKTRHNKNNDDDEDSDDDDLFHFAGPAVTTQISQRVVTPGETTRTNMKQKKTTAILDDDDDDNDEDVDAGETDADLTNVAPITNYFKPKVITTAGTTERNKPTSLQMSKSSSTTTAGVIPSHKPEDSTSTTTSAVTTKKIVKKAPPVNFFAPRPSKVVVPPKETSDNNSDDDTVMATPPRDAPKTPPRAPSSSLYKHLYQSTSKTQQDIDEEEKMMDYVNERHVSPLRPTKETTPVVQPKSAEGIRKRRNFFGTKAPPSRRSALQALDQADQSPARRNLYAGLQSSTSPTRRLVPTTTDDTPLSPPRKRMTFEPPNSPLSVIKTTAARPHVSPAHSFFRGLRNFGNTCYMNSSLQMLFSIPDFVKALKPFSDGRRLVDSFCDIFREVIYPVEAYVGSASARQLKIAVDGTTDKFRGNQQRDAHEFLGHLIDGIHEEIEPKKAEVETSNDGRSSISSPRMDAILPTDDYFRLNVEVCLKCKSCGYSRYVISIGLWNERINVQPGLCEDPIHLSCWLLSFYHPRPSRTKEEMYRYLSLDIHDERLGHSLNTTVERCLGKFFEPEDREIKCEKCEEGIEATQTLRVLSRPRVLLLHLKRFRVVETRTGGTDEMEIRVQKNKVPVELNDKLSLDTFLSPKDTTPSNLSSMYSLRSIVHHIGNKADSGHYTADVLREKMVDGETTNQWVSYDDSMATETTLPDIRRKQSNKETAYMLLYSATER